MSDKPQSYAEMLKTLKEFKAAIDRLPKDPEPFIYLLSPEAADRLAKICPEALRLDNVKVDRLGVVSAGCCLKLPDMRAGLSIFNLPLDLKP